MYYNEIVTRIRATQQGRCAIDDFIMSSRDDAKKKIIALNFFEEIHFSVLEEERLNRCINEIETQLEQFRNEADFFNKCNSINLNTANFMPTVPSTLNHNTQLSMVMMIDGIIKTIENEQLYSRGKNRTTTKKQQINNIVTFPPEYCSRIISDFTRKLATEPGAMSSIRIKENNKVKIVWATDDSEINGIADATELRNILGLYYRKGAVLVKITLRGNPQQWWHKPTFFHSGMFPHWLPSHQNDGWGRTLNLANFTESVRETVSENNITWSETLEIRLLGCCEEDVQTQGWEDYLNVRLNNIRQRCINDESVLNDFQYFLEKIDTTI